MEIPDSDCSRSHSYTDSLRVFRKWYAENTLEMIHVSERTARSERIVYELWLENRWESIKSVTRFLKSIVEQKERVVKRIKEGK